MQSTLPLEPGKYYHIYNRGNNGENIFIEERNYTYFMNLYARYIDPVAETFAYCLLRNHFHVGVRIKEDLGGLGDLRGLKNPGQPFSNFFNAYSKAINRAYGRTGSLFENRLSPQGSNHRSLFPAADPLHSLESSETWLRGGLSRLSLFFVSSLSHGQANFRETC